MFESDENEFSTVQRLVLSKHPNATFGRRTVLAAIAGQISFGQTPVGSAIRKGLTDIRIQPHGDPQLPAVAVFLPDKPDPCAVIEMPEHAWRQQKTSDQQTWFYKMYGSDPKLKGQVDWHSSPNQVAYKMTTPSGYVLSGSASVEPDGVAISYEINTGGEDAIAVLEATTCVKLYRPFTDVFLERTYVHHSGGLQLIASETPERLQKNAEEWLPCRYIARVGKDLPQTRYKVEKLDGVTRFFSSRAADTPFLATESQPSGWTAATVGNNCDSVFTNPARTCHHADPRLHNVTGGLAKVNLKVYFIRGSAVDAWAVAGKRATNEPR